MNSTQKQQYQKDLQSINTNGRGRAKAFPKPNRFNVATASRESCKPLQIQSKAKIKSNNFIKHERRSKQCQNLLYNH